jgi:hypothetical protein
VENCGRFTTTPNAVTSVVHNPMRVIPDPEGYELCHDPGMTSPNATSDLLKAFDARLVRCLADKQSDHRALEVAFSDDKGKERVEQLKVLSEE